MYCCVNYYLFFLGVCDGAGGGCHGGGEGWLAIRNGKSTNFFRHTTAFQM